MCLLSLTFINSGQITLMFNYVPIAQELYETSLFHNKMDSMIIMIYFICIFNKIKFLIFKLEEKVLNRNNLLTMKKKTKPFWNVASGDFSYPVWGQMDFSAMFKCCVIL